MPLSGVGPYPAVDGGYVAWNHVITPALTNGRTLSIKKRTNLYEQKFWFKWQAEFADL